MNLQYHNLSEEELDSKIEDVTKKINMAARMGQDAVVEQLQTFLEELNLEMQERLEVMRFAIINDNTPESLILGEDDDTDAPTDGE